MDHSDHVPTKFKIQLIYPKKAWKKISWTFGLRLYGGSAMAHFPWDLERAPSLITVLLATFTAAAPIGRTVLPSVSNQPTYQPSLHLGGKVHKFLVKSSSVATISARPS